MKNKKLSLKKKLVIGAIGLASFLPMKNANAQVTGSLEAIKSLTPKKSYLRPMLSYDLPLGVKGSSFLEFYQDGSSYFGKTILTKKINKGIGLRAGVNHGSGFTDNYNLGVSVAIPGKKTFTNFYYSPLCVDNKLKKMKNKALAGYFISTKLPFGLELNSFGQLNLNAEGGAQWNYGEMNLEKKLNKNLAVSFNPALRNQGGPIPKLEPRFTVKYSFD